MSLTNVLNEFFSVSMTPPTDFHERAWCRPPSWFSSYVWVVQRMDGQDLYQAIGVLFDMCEV